MASNCSQPFCKSCRITSVLAELGPSALVIQPDISGYNENSSASNTEYTVCLNCLDLIDRGQPRIYEACVVAIPTTAPGAKSWWIPTIYPRTHTRGLRFFFTMTSHERESVSNHQPLDCLFNANTKESIKVQRYWSFLWESTGGFHSQRVSDAEKNFPYDYVIIKFSAVNFAHIHHACFLWNRSCYCSKTTQIGKFMGPTWGPPGSCWPQLGPMLAPWTLLSGQWSNPKIYG